MLFGAAVDAARRGAAAAWRGRAAAATARQPRSAPSVTRCLCISWQSRATAPPLVLRSSARVFLDVYFLTFCASAGTMEVDVSARVLPAAAVLHRRRGVSTGLVCSASSSRALAVIEPALRECSHVRCNPVQHSHARLLQRRVGVVRPLSSVSADARSGGLSAAIRLCSRPRAIAGLASSAGASMVAVRSPHGFARQCL